MENIVQTLDVLKHLENIQFVGPFPNGITVLLVSFENALVEAKTIDSTLTHTRLRDLLKKHNILVFNSIDDYIKQTKIKK